MSVDFIPVVYSVDNNYTIPLCTSIKSLVKNNKQGNYKIYILYSKNNLSDWNKFLISLNSESNFEIEFVQIDDKLFADFITSPECNYISKETYYRFILPSKLSQFDKVLYLDCDTIILSDIRELYNTDITDFYIAGADDYTKDGFCKRLNISEYVNAGVLLFNLKKIREENFQQKLFDYYFENINNLPYQDQDVINVVFQGGIKVFDKSWNVQLFQDELAEQKDINTSNKDEKILHYICNPKPWHKGYKSNYKKFYYKYFYSLNIITLLDYCMSIINSFRKNIIYYRKSDKTFVIFKCFNMKI